MPVELDKSKIKALIFDVDGTLRDTDDEMVRSLELLLLKFEFFFSSKKAQTSARWIVMNMENPAQVILHYADKWGWDTLIHKFVQVIRWLLKPLKKSTNFQTIEGIEAMIAELSKHYPLAVASAGEEATVRNFLNHAGIAQYFTCVATALTCPHTKPFADPLVWAALQMGVKPDECLMIGDTTVDILAGKNANTQTVGVLCGFGEREELTSLKPELILNTTSELTQILLNN
ncbi:HAD-superfamily hydrolase, subfamily IA, variant 1 [Emticicia oligotrophica DSM 17448]|uniref:phosphoglycolate phosphatase n=1 Tax=Emticicia oligotrophica (strain DSM 17448 / CIP 109782 / MTCC 6937 / GPTSA100-15) TaxID=929562 RepID=A0ABN4APP3_EMTOG|nr:HAD family hydrolase [Emticicia oligotrophica]AFK04417.1 HAD-superfamily hydrolase, subfamily IA, variant 1 [Emticicia oligotrophica DSM 17448]